MAFELNIKYKNPAKSYKDIFDIINEYIDYGYIVKEAHLVINISNLIYGHKLVSTDNLKNMFIDFAAYNYYKISKLTYKYENYLVYDIYNYYNELFNTIYNAILYVSHKPYNVEKFKCDILIYINKYYI